jgi:hypothetical protein
MCSLAPYYPRFFFLPEEDDWEKEDTEEPVVASAAGAGDDWDEEESPEAFKAREAARLAIEKEKYETLKAERDAIEAKKKGAAESKRLAALALTSETPEQRKIRLQNAVEEADAELTDDLFGVGAAADSKPAGETLQEFHPKNAAQAEELASLASSRLIDVAVRIQRVAAA